MTKEIYCGKLVMTPSEARAYTLREIIEFCEYAMGLQEVGSGDERGIILRNPDKYFALKEVKEHAEKLLNQINY